MRILLVALLALIAGTVQAQPTDMPYWTPDMAAIQRLELKIVMPQGVQKPFEAYGRYYAGITRDGKRLIHGELVLPQITNEFPRIYIRDDNKLPGVDDGGCGVVELFYDVDADKIVSIKCNGVA